MLHASSGVNAVLLRYHIPADFILALFQSLFLSLGLTNAVLAWHVCALQASIKCHSQFAIGPITPSNISACRSANSPL
jgi:hypothetical protein